MNNIFNKMTRPFLYYADIDWLANEYEKLKPNVKQMINDIVNEWLNISNIKPSMKSSTFMANVIGNTLDNVIQLKGMPRVNDRRDGIKYMRDLYKKFKPVVKILKKEMKEQQEKIKKERLKMKQKLKEQSKNEKNRKPPKEIKLKKNKFCKNNRDFITLENIDEILSKNLIHIKLEENIYCYDKESFINMIKYANKRYINNQWYYAINIGYNVYITEQNYKELKIKKKYLLKNEKKINNIIIYDLVSSNYPLTKKNVKDMSKKKYTVKQLKEMAKEKGLKGYSKLRKQELLDLLNL
jgi:hypothetical protein